MISLIAGHRYEFDDSARRFFATFERVEHDVRLDGADNWQPVSVYYFADRVPYATALPMAIRSA